MRFKAKWLSPTARARFKFISLRIRINKRLPMSIINQPDCL